MIEQFMRAVYRRGGGGGGGGGGVVCKCLSLMVWEAF